MKIAEDVCGKKPNVYYLPERDYMKNHVVDNTKITKATGWKPTVTVKEGMEIIYKRKNGND